MRWDDFRRSDNVEENSGGGGGGFGGMRLGGGAVIEFFPAGPMGRIGRAGDDAGERARRTGSPRRRR